MPAAVFPEPPKPSAISEANLASLESVPLFMKELPEDALDDPTLSALQSLVFDGTPDETAQNFKEQGNDCFKEKRYRDALGFYTQGVDAKPTDPQILEALLCNRAACNIELKNYGKVLKDCSTALVANPKCSKAYYRSGLALVFLERYEEALDCCDLCLVYDKENKGIRGLRDNIIKLKQTRDSKEQEKRERTLREEKEKKQLHAAFRERSLITITNPESPSDTPYAPHFDPEDPTGKTLIIPVFFLYPQHAISDIISHFVEDTPFSAHLAAMFPPESSPPDWDKNGEYENGKLSVYAMTHRKRLLKVGKSMTLRDVFDAAKAKEGDPTDGLEVKDGCLTFAVLPRGEVEKRWIEEYKKARDGP